MKKIIYTRPDGGISVVTPILELLEERAGFTEAEAEQRAWNKLPVNAINPVFVDAVAIPQDRSQRESWVHGADRVIVDVSKVTEPASKQETAASLKAALIAKGLLTQADVDAASSK